MDRYRKHKKRGKNQRDFMLLGLKAADRPLSLHDFRHQLQRMGYHFGMPEFLVKHDQTNLRDEDLLSNLDVLHSEGFVRRLEDDRFELTSTGMEKATSMDAEMSSAVERLSRLVNDSTLASMLSVCVNAVLAALKLTAGFTFSSVALIADGFDSTVDVLSATVVFLGIRYKRELASTVFIIVMMFATAAFIGYESIIRLLHNETVDPSVLTFVAAVVSGLICYIMSVYQHTVGKRAGSLPLISQSVDSHNHVIQAAAVLIGLCCARFNIFIVDALVGLIVAGLILKSGVELAIETYNTAQSGALDATKFETRYERAWNSRQRRYFETWLLMLLNEPHTKEDILSHYHEIFSTDDLPVVRHFSPARTFNLPENLDAILLSLQTSERIERVGDKYVTTSIGREELARDTKRWRFVAG
ncbi:MAG: cation diffusion facilitator family transporter [Dehalococcoidia bacterium]|nr:cation diffusion facilitator family transporter [Dehalococcoidia bacterium]